MAQIYNKSIEFVIHTRLFFSFGNQKIITHGNCITYCSKIAISQISIVIQDREASSNLVPRIKL